MPIYEFKCGSCAEQFELLVASSSSDIACPSCGSGECDKLMSTFGFSSGGQFTSSHGGGECTGCARGSCQGCK